MTCAGTGGYILSGIKVQMESGSRPLTGLHAPASTRPQPTGSPAAAEGGGGGGADTADAAVEVGLLGRLSRTGVEGV